jgi:hypothetical protein
MAARVVFTAGFSRRYTGGVREFTVEARNLRGVIKAMNSIPASASISSRKPPSPSTVPSTRPPISSRSAQAARSSSSPSSKADSTTPAQTPQLIVREALVLGKYTFAATEIDIAGVFCDLI